MKVFSKNSNYEKYYKDFVPKLKKEENQKYFYIALSIGASVFFLIFAVNPTLSTIANLKRQIKDARFIESRLSDKVNSLSSLSQEYQIVEDDISYVTDAVPHSPEAPTLVGQIRSLGNASSVQLTGVEILPVSLTSKTSTKSAELNFVVTGNSDLINSQKFLTNLANMQRVLSISSVQVTNNSKTEGQFDFIFKGTAYFKK